MIDATFGNIMKYLNLNQFDDALKVTHDNLDILGVNSKTYSLLGVIYYQKNELAVARKMLKLGLLLNRFDLDILYNLATIEYIQKNYNASLNFLTIAKKVCSNPSEVETINQLIVENVKKIHGGKLSYPLINKTFLDLLTDEIIISLENNFFDNLDYDVMDVSSPDVVANHEYVTSQIHNHIDGISMLYEKLTDNNSKELLVKLMAFKVLGHHKIKLPLNNKHYWNERAFVDTLKNEEDKIRINFKELYFHLFDLEEIGYPMRFYYASNGIQTTFVQKQYEHSEVRVEEGDYVIDAGGCYGDTALYFAHEVGELGKVYTFEFIQSNLLIMKKNLELNENLLKRITVINKPVWEISDSELYYLDFGPASRVSNQPIYENKTTTISIDDFIESHNVPKVDFIKMDIEGAELSALKGSKNTIIKHKPKLAICLYHSINDFAAIIEYILSLGINYSFYLGHYTIFDEETLLYAIPVKE